MERIYKLKGVVQHYSWGGTNYLPELLGLSNEENKPHAEYWLGAHPKSPAVIDEQNLSLHDFIKAHPAETLGEQVQSKFGSLPYLFKILDVKNMLSIQVHPSKAAAEEEFEKEERSGIALGAPNRNYKDRNHKPELMVALSDFWLLHGFKKEEDVQEILRSVPELTFLLPIFGDGDYEALYQRVMTMPQEEVDAVLGPLLDRIVPAYKQNTLQKSSADFWAARAALTFCKDDHVDRGIFSVYLFNLLHLTKGEAIYQAAEMPHAYLEGQNVEVMANSDNVLRAGLTDKHVDVPELMKHVKFEATRPNILSADQKSEQSFDAPVEEFHLKKYQPGGPISVPIKTATIVFATEGAGSFGGGRNTTEIKRGEALLLLPDGDLLARPSGAEFTFFSVSTPLDKN